MATLYRQCSHTVANVMFGKVDRENSLPDRGSRCGACQGSHEVPCQACDGRGHTPCHNCINGRQISDDYICIYCDGIGNERLVICRIQRENKPVLQVHCVRLLRRRLDNMYRMLRKVTWILYFESNFSNSWRRESRVVKFTRRYLLLQQRIGLGDFASRLTLD